jgi:hypothetical protein
VKLELESSQAKGGELHGIMAKLEEGLSWIGRSCGGLPTGSREVIGEELERRRWISKFGVKCECKREQNGRRKATECLRQVKKGEEGTHGASHDGNEVAAVQSSGRGGAAWSARKEAREEELGWRLARRRRVGATRAGGGADKVAATVSGGRGAARSSCGATWRARGKPAERG